MKDVRKHKGLQSQLKQLQADSEVIKIDIANKQREYEAKLSSIRKLKEEINKLNFKKTPKLSEHALCRYFERVKGYDISEIENEILCDDVLNMVDKLGGNGTYPNPKGFSVVMKNFVVITIT